MFIRRFLFTRQNTSGLVGLSTNCSALRPWRFIFWKGGLI